MEDLRLHQTIYADSTCYFSGQIVEIHKTTLADAVTDSSGKTHIKLGAGHNWGCIPNRDRNRVIANESDIRPFVEEKIKSIIDDSVNFAKNSPEPSENELYTDIYK